MNLLGKDGPNGTAKKCVSKLSFSIALTSQQDRFAKNVLLWKLFIYIYRECSVQLMPSFRMRTEEKKVY